jgi:hypothetical protein
MKIPQAALHIASAWFYAQRARSRCFAATLEYRDHFHRALPVILEFGDRFIVQLLQLERQQVILMIIAQLGLKRTVPGFCFNILTSSLWYRHGGALVEANVIS